MKSSIARGLDIAGVLALLALSAAHMPPPWGGRLLLAVFLLYSAWLAGRGVGVSAGKGWGG